MLPPKEKAISGVKPPRKKGQHDVVYPSPGFHSLSDPDWMDAFCSKTSLSIFPFTVLLSVSVAAAVGRLFSEFVGSNPM